MDSEPDWDMANQNCDRRPTFHVACVGERKKLGMYAPAFSWQAMLELAVSLAITVLVVQNGQSERADFDAPAG